MSEGTIDALLTSGACLYGFKAVAAWDKAALPLVWLRTERYSLRTSILVGRAIRGLHLTVDAEAGKCILSNRARPDP